MPISLRDDQYPNISEVWGIGTNSIVAYTTDGRCVKITARHNIRSGTTPNYFASYEERREIHIGGETSEVWARADYPWQDGRTVEECLVLALQWIER